MGKLRLHVLGVLNGIRTIAGGEGDWIRAIGYEALLRLPNGVLPVGNIARI